MNRRALNPSRLGVAQVVRLRSALVALCVGAALAACSQAESPASLADHTTKAVYDVDIGGTVANMDDDLKKQVTRASVGDLSDKMHTLGAYKGIKQTSAEPDKGRYAFEADFDHGALAVELRLDPTGKIGAYRVSPLSR